MGSLYFYIQQLGLGHGSFSACWGSIYLYLDGKVKVEMKLHTNRQDPSLLFPACSQFVNSPEQKKRDLKEGCNIYGRTGKKKM